MLYESFKKEYMIPKLLYKYRSWQENEEFLQEEMKFEKQILTKRNIFFSNPKDFNDPFDIAIPKRFDLIKHNKFSDFLNYYKKTIDDLDWNVFIKNSDEYIRKETLSFCNRHGVFSTSKDPANILMWSHYANKHKGFCIGFDASAFFNYLKSVEKEKDSHIGLGKVKYKSKMPLIKPSTNNFKRINDIKIRLLTKYNLWTYEKEWRFIQLLNNNNDNHRLIELDKSLYKQIIFGCNILPNIKEEIYKTLKDFPDIKIYNAVKVNGSYKLKIVED